MLFNNIDKIPNQLKRYNKIKLEDMIVPNQLDYENFGQLEELVICLKPFFH